MTTTSTVEAREDGAVSWPLLVVLASLAALAPVATDLYLPGFPEMHRDLGVPASAVQLTLTAFLVGLAFGQLVMGPLSDRFGRRRPLLVSAAVCVVAGVACAAAPTLPVLVAARLVQGFAGACGMVIGRAVISERGDRPSDVETRQHRAIEEGEAIPVRISHAVMNSNDPNRTRDFYANVLGFKLSDTLWGEHMGEMMHFMRCNDWHHCLAIARGPHTSLHHVSFEMRGLDEYMRGTGRVMRAGIKKIWGPGRHNAGNNTFSYFLDPSGNTMEYTTELEKIETDEWHPSVYDIADPMTQDVWGTADPMSEIIARDSFNDPDRGVFVAPPV